MPLLWGGAGGEEELMPVGEDLDFLGDLSVEQIEELLQQPNVGDFQFVNVC